MGVVLRAEETLVSELEQLRRKLVACDGIQRRKGDEETKALKSRPVDDPEEKVVCVTSGVSFLGSAIVNELLLHGYFVRIVVGNPEDMNKLEETASRSSNVSVVAATLTDVSSLMEAFNGCRGVFHTSSSIDPAGLSGYTKIMSQVETKSTECVMEACARTPSVRNCVLTSSLLACVWRDSHERAGGTEAVSPVVNHDCWSTLQLCQDKKLWYALGKLEAERAAWRMAEESGLNLATICPALITGPNFHRQNSTATMAYLKGAREMYANGLLATADVFRVAKAHVCVYDGMKEDGSGGRYICFDRVITTEEAAENLAMEMGVPAGTIIQTPTTHSAIPRSRLSNKKLCNLMSRNVRRCYSENQFLKHY